MTGSLIGTSYSAVLCNMEVIKSNKGGNKICHDGYTYTKSCLRKDKMWWKCSKKASLSIVCNILITLT